MISWIILASPHNPLLETDKQGLQGSSLLHGRFLSFVMVLIQNIFSCLRIASSQLALKFSSSRNFRHLRLWQVFKNSRIEKESELCLFSLVVCIRKYLCIKGYVLKSIIDFIELFSFSLPSSSNILLPARCSRSLGLQGTSKSCSAILNLYFAFYSQLHLSDEKPSNILISLHTPSSIRCR